MTKDKRFDLGKNLKKNERFKLTKGAGYNKIQVELSWNTIGISNYGLKGLDLDANAFLVGDEGIINNDEDFVFYNSESRWLPSDPRWADVVDELLSVENIDLTEGNFAPFDKVKYRNKRKWRKYTLPVSKDGSVIGSWDDPGSGDDDNAGETMHVVLDNVNEDVCEIIFCVSIFQNPDNGPVDIQTFEKVNNAKIEIKDEETDRVLCSYNLNEKFIGKTAVEVARLSKNDDDEWEFVALGDGHDGGLQTLIDIYA